MLAARDQENLVHGHHQAAAAKPLNQAVARLQPKTPGTKYPKTPLKVPLNDENVPAGFGGKSGKGKGIENLMTGKKGTATTFDKNAFVTPMGPRTRAPLGMKTTNAKTKAFQTPSAAAPEPGKELEKTQVPKSTTRRARKITHGETVKLQVHGDESPLADRDVEYCPPKPTDLPYESSDFPRNCLNYDILKPDNLMRGIHSTYHQENDENGLSKIERVYRSNYEKSAREGDEKVRAMMDEEWTVGDVPETFRHIRKKAHGPKQASSHTKTQTKPNTITPKFQPTRPQPIATLTSRTAASALSLSKPTAPLAPQVKKFAPAKQSSVFKPSFLARGMANPTEAQPPSTMRHQAANAASRSTIGYTKGRSAASAVHVNAGGIYKDTTTPAGEGAVGRKEKAAGVFGDISEGSDGMSVSAIAAKFEGSERGSEQWRRLKFLGAFEGEEDDGSGLGGGVPECWKGADGEEEEEEEEFVMVLGQRN